MKNLNAELWFYISQSQTPYYSFNTALVRVWTLYKFLQQYHFPVNNLLVVTIVLSFLPAEIDRKNVRVKKKFKRIHTACLPYYSECVHLKPHIA